MEQHCINDINVCGPVDRSDVPCCYYCTSLFLPFSNVLTDSKTGYSRKQKFEIQAAALAGWSYEWAYDVNTAE